MRRIFSLPALFAVAALIVPTTVVAQQARPEQGGGRVEQPANKGKDVARFTAVSPTGSTQMGDRASASGVTARGGVWTQSGWEKVTANWQAQDGAKFAACQKEAQDQRLEGNAARSRVASCMNRS
jgi:hypothetical protein